MTNAAVLELVLIKLKELVDYGWHLIGDNSGHIVRLLRDLLEMNAFLEDSLTVKKQRDGHMSTNSIVKEIYKVVSEVEEIIDVFLNKIVAPNYSEIKNSEISLLRKFWKIPLNLLTVGKEVDLHTVGKEVDLHTVSKKVEKVRKRVQQAMDDPGIVQREAEPEAQQSQVRFLREDMVGFEDEADDLINRLTRDSNCLEVISLVGMLGLGKTTLAWKVYKDPAIQYEFPIRIWLSISQEFSDRDIFLSILNKFTTVTYEMESKADREIADVVIAYLEGEKFLIIMDDVWETAHWSRLKVVLPKNSKGKVLITTRNEQVANFASRTESIKKLRYLSPQESWMLLELDARHTHCPPDLECVGREIAINCKGLPLVVAIIGNIWINALEERWWKLVVSRGVSRYLNATDEKYQYRLRNSISLSYDILPFHLRLCFLYFGMFPEDYEIPVSKLIQMWIGEGFIQHSEYCSLEETAEQYLEELIERNLVKSEKFKHDGKAKTCRIHDILHAFCQTEASNENLFKEIRYDGEIFTPPIDDMNKYSRLSVHSNCKKFISSIPFCPLVHSFVCFSKHKFVVSERNSSKLLAAFEHLKVLDVEPFEFSKIDIDIYQLVYLRYLVLSTNLSVLRSEFRQLRNIQTLIIHTTSRTLEVKVDIWKMKKLRYFKTNASAILPKPRKISKYGKELKRLGTISVESCTPELFTLASNLKKLGISGNLSLLLNGSSGTFDSLGKMESIEKLELINDVYPFPSSEKPMRDLPQHHQFPSGLKSLTLRATFLSWDAMSTLALLKKLEVLKLKENAFMGAIWKGNADVGGFRCLQLLHIEDTDLIIWNASSLCYPKLRSLVLHNCEKLLEIPNGIADIPSLQKLDLYMCRSAAASAKAIKESKIKTQPEGSAFMLSIFPPNERSILTGYHVN